MTDETPSLSLQSINQLVPRVRAGDDEARNEICQQVQDYLRLMAAKQIGPDLQRKLNPSDLVQVTMTRMINGIDEFRGTTDAEFYGWLNQILHNETHSTRRNLHRQKRDIKRERELADSSQNQPRAQLADPNLTPSSEAIQAEKLAHFHQALAQLSADQAQVIELRSLQELPFQQVAEIMGRSYDATAKLWSRAVVRLQEELERSN